MNDDYYIYLSLVALVGGLIFLRFYGRVDFEAEKIKFSCGKSGEGLATFVVNIFVSYPKSQMCTNSAENGLVYKINSSISWQYIEMQNSSFSPVKCDSIFFTDRSYPKICFIKSTFLKPLFNSSVAIPKKLEDFLEKYNLGIESGEWGAVLIREGKPILASELNGLIDEFKGLSW